MERPNLQSAFRAARMTAFYRDGARIMPAPASRAIAEARANLGRFHDAAADREDKAAARDARKAGPGIDVAALAAAEAALDVATRRLRAAEGLAGSYAGPVWGGGDYGAGTWQGAGTGDTSPALPFYLPPAFAYSDATRAAGAWRGARHMDSRRQCEGAAAPFGRGGTFYLRNTGGGATVLRNVADAPDVWRGASQWYDNPHGESFRDGTGLVVGVVGQLRGRDGRARYVAGWRFCGHEDNGTFDMTEVYTAAGREEWQAEEAAEEAARAADSLAEAAAEAEREYQSAWGAGRAWAEAAESIAAARQSARELLAERRAAIRAGAANLPAICRAVRDSVSGFLADMAEARREREELAEGDSPTWPFYPDKRARVAFCEGAGIPVEAFPG